MKFILCKDPSKVFVTWSVNLMNYPRSAKKLNLESLQRSNQMLTFHDVDIYNNIGIAILKNDATYTIFWLSVDQQLALKNIENQELFVSRKVTTKNPCWYAVWYYDMDNLPTVDIFFPAGFHPDDF